MSSSRGLSNQWSPQELEQTLAYFTGYFGLGASKLMPEIDERILKVCLYCVSKLFSGGLVETRRVLGHYEAILGSSRGRARLGSWVSLAWSQHHVQRERVS